MSENQRIALDSRGIEIKGYRGKWHMVCQTELMGRVCFVVEHEDPDLHDDLMIDELGRVVTEDVWQ